MKDNPFVSVIIPVYNRVSLIQETLQSVIDQTYPYWEAIVVDDGSTDGSYELVIKFTELDHRIKVFRRDREPKGAPVCRNIGVAKSVGQYLIFLDSDDLLAPFCLEQRMNLFHENKELDFIVLPTLLFSNDVSDLNAQWNIDTTEDDLLRFFGVDGVWPINGPIYKREAILQLEGLREDLPFWQDFDLHIRCLLTGLAYRKFFNHRPDNYVRKNYKDSISRTISYTKDRQILQRRMDFYFALVQFIRERKKNITDQQKYAIWSVLFFLAVGYFKDHNDLRRFSREWDRVRVALNIGWMSHHLNFIYGTLIGLSVKNIFFKIPSKLWFYTFGRRLANYRIISQRTLGKIPRDQLQVQSEEK
jgi:glycosyltransferase involved in cell wall biosynthesis